MARISVADVTTANLDDLCWLCVPSARRDDPAFEEGVRAKRRSMVPRFVLFRTSCSNRPKRRSATAPELPGRWISQSEEPEAAVRRGGYAGCIVNGSPITAFVLDRDRFRQEVQTALGAAYT